jgi:CrcB protein
VLDVLIGVFAHRLNVPLWPQAGATVGFLGAYTTFSTLSLQVYRSTATGHLPVALANAVGSLVVGTLALYAGIVLTRAF